MEDIVGPRRGAFILRHQPVRDSDDDDDENVPGENVRWTGRADRISHTRRAPCPPKGLRRRHERIINE